MKRDLALECLKAHVTEDDIVVAVYQTCFDWLVLNPRDLNYVATGAMGQASSHGLGLALANPDRRVVVFDGDGSLLMNLGSLVTVAEAQPENFHHFLFFNGVYEVNGAHPIPGKDTVDFQGMALAAGYRSAESFTELTSLEKNVAGILDAPGPTFTELRVEPGAAYPRDYAYIHSSEARERFRQALNRG
ncbi:MAG: thiamine pyrophosphate-dependent enzyme [Pseudomonadota bacterium]